MRVAIIASPYPLEEAPAPPLGLTYVAAAFERAGADVRIFDYIVSRYTPGEAPAGHGRVRSPGCRYVVCNPQFPGLRTFSRPRNVSILIL